VLRSSRPPRDVFPSQLAYERERNLTRVASWIGLIEGGRFLWHEPSADALHSGQFVAQLCHYTQRDKSARTRPPLLLVHGASAWRGTFMERGGGLVAHLLPERDVWTLDWRSSKVITDHWRASSAPVPDSLRHMNLDLSAEQELPAAVEHIASHTGRVPDLVGHCMGSALIAMALARGALAARTPHSVVLSALGLFYRGTVDTWFRAQERIDAPERDDNAVWYLDFAADGPLAPPYQDVFELWQKTPYVHCDVLFCQRISAILGCPYRPDDIGYLHDAVGHDGLATQFGVMPLGILNHCARNVRRGWSAAVSGTDSDRRDLAHPEHFQRVHKLTLMTGSENQLWHRDSIDRMYEWLHRLGTWSRDEAGEPRLSKRIFERYGHQDLFLSPLASTPGSVYDYVRKRL
jgi:pimeloyl-ACP methyl ester carboxylesterase